MKGMSASCGGVEKEILIYNICVIEVISCNTYIVIIKYKVNFTYLRRYRYMHKHIPELSSVKLKLFRDRNAIHFIQVTSKSANQEMYKFKC